MNVRMRTLRIGFTEPELQKLQHGLIYAIEIEQFQTWVVIKKQRIRRYARELTILDPDFPHLEPNNHRRGPQMGSRVSSHH